MKPKLPTAYQRTQLLTLARMGEFNGRNVNRLTLRSLLRYGWIVCTDPTGFPKYRVTDEGLRLARSRRKGRGRVPPPPPCAIPIPYVEGAANRCKFEGVITNAISKRRNGLWSLVVAQKIRTRNGYRDLRARMFVSDKAVAKRLRETEPGTWISVDGQLMIWGIGQGIKIIDYTVVAEPTVGMDLRDSSNIFDRVIGGL